MTLRPKSLTDEQHNQLADWPVQNRNLCLFAVYLKSIRYLLCDRDPLYGIKLYLEYCELMELRGRIWSSVPWIWVAGRTNFI